MSAAIFFMLFVVLLSIGIVLFCVLLGTLEPKKLYVVHYKERLHIMPLHSSATISARRPEAAVKKFYKEYGKNFDIESVKEMKA